MTQITDASLALFLELAADAPNWGGTPWVNGGNVELTPELRGNFTQLKRANLLYVVDHEGDGRTDDMYIKFTAAGYALAASYGLTID